MGKIVTYILVLFSITALHAATYLSGSVGYAKYFFHHAIQDPNSLEPLSEFEDQTNSFFEGIGAGYQWLTPTYFWRTGLYYINHGASEVYHGRFTDTTKGYKDEIQALFMPGYKLKDKWSVLGILGAAHGRFSFQAAGRENYQINYSDYGFVLGLGTEYQITKQVSGQIAYEYEQFFKRNGFNISQGRYLRNGYTYTHGVIFNLVYQFA